MPSKKSQSESDNDQSDFEALLNASQQGGVKRNKSENRLMDGDTKVRNRKVSTDFDKLLEQGVDTHSEVKKRQPRKPKKGLEPMLENVNDDQVVVKKKRQQVNQPTNDHMFDLEQLRQKPVKKDPVVSKMRKELELEIKVKDLLTKERSLTNELNKVKMQLEKLHK
jgi:hypothetical protein